MNDMTQPKYAMAIAQAEKKFTEIAALDGNLVSYQREAMFALQIAGGSEYLQKAAPDTLRNAVINVASVGLTLNPAMKLAYLVPRDGKACLDISYIGLIKIATDTGAVSMVKAETVYEKDTFQYEGPFTAPTHRFDPFAPLEERGSLIGAYCIAKMRNGEVLIEVLRRSEIDKIRSKSKAKSGPWFDFFEEMVKKSIIKRASKMWPRTERMAMAEQVLNDHEGFETIDTTTGEVTQRPPMPTAKTSDQPTGWGGLDKEPISEKPPVADVIEGTCETVTEKPAESKGEPAPENQGASPTVSPGQAANIRNKAKTLGKDEAALCQEFGVAGNSFDACDQTQWLAIKAKLSGN